MVKDYNLELLRQGGDSYLSRSMLDKIDNTKSIEGYNKRRIPVGYTKKGKLFFLENKDAMRVAVVGRTGSGKSFLIRGIIDRLYKSNCDICILNDLKNEFHSSLKPVQPKFQKMLLPGERPSRLPMCTIRPYFFSTVPGDNFKKKYNYWGSVSLSDVTEADFKEFMAYKDLTLTQKMAVDMVYTEIEKRGKLESLDIIDEIIDNIDGLHDGTKQSLKHKLWMVKKKKFFSPNFVCNPASIILDGCIPSLNLEGYDKFGRINEKESFGNFPRIILGMWLNMLINAKRNKILKKTLWLIIDEAEQFIRPDVDSSVKTIVESSYKRDRRYDVNFILASQELDKVPSELINMSKYIFIPFNINAKELKEILISQGKLKIDNQVSRRIGELKATMKKFDWLVVDTDTAIYEIVTPLGPLSHHLETE